MRLVSTDGTTVDVGVGFDERINDTAAGVAANYSISPGTISSFTYYPKSQSALLKVTGLAAGASATVTVKNVADVKGNAITSVNVPVTVSSTIKWNVVGGAELGLAGNYVVPISDDGFDIYSNGIGQWASYDETTFVYEEITGDFDKKAQVIFQDLSSSVGSGWSYRTGRDELRRGSRRPDRISGPPIVVGLRALSEGARQSVRTDPHRAGHGR